MAYQKTPNASPFAVRDRILVSGVSGEVMGVVIEAATVDEMPDLGPGSLSKEAKDVMREMRVDFMLLISHQHNGRTVCFWAVHNPDGWTDLHGQSLTVLKGYIPLVTMEYDVHKITRAEVRRALEEQAKTYGKKIRLVRFVVDAVVEETEGGA
jgi:hypothetical protein